MDFLGNVSMNWQLLGGLFIGGLLKAGVLEGQSVSGKSRRAAGSSSARELRGVLSAGV